ncbi:MAG: hypothetical protein KAG18_01280 [Sinobacterium sp.]|nr:hypothetical protein [Sinobacterium sp.]
MNFFSRVIVIVFFIGLAACSGTQTSEESLDQVAIIKSWEFSADIDDVSAVNLLASQLIEASQFAQLEYVDSGYAGAHKRIYATVLVDSIVLNYSYHPRGDAARKYYSKSTVRYPVQIVRNSGESFIYIHSPSEFSQEATSGELAFTSVAAFAEKDVILKDAQNIFRSLAVTALQRRVDGEGIQKYLPIEPGLVVLELYVTTGCEVQVDNTEAAVCEFNGVSYEAWVSSQGEGAILAIDFFQEYIVRGVDASALDRVLDNLEQAQESMLNTLDLPLTE